MENKVISREYVEKNYIQKDKIREKIKELEHFRDNPKRAKHCTAWYIRRIEALQELLEDIKYE